MAYRYADGRAKCINFKIKSDYASNRRVLSHDNTDNLHEIKVTNSLVSLNKEGVVRVQHPIDRLKFFVSIYFHVVREFMAKLDTRKKNG